MNDIIIRESKISDEIQLQQLWKRNNFFIKNQKKNWDILWSKNPTYTKEWPIGWVLELGGKIVGSIENIPLTYYFHGKKINTAALRGFVVDVKARSHSLKLLSYFFSQRNVDLFLSTTCNKSTAAILKMFHAHPLPCSSYKSVLYWIVNSKDVIKTELIKFFKFENVIIDLMALAITPFFSILLRILKHGIIKNNSNWKGQIEVISPKNIDGEFNELWFNKKKELSNTLIADRSVQILKWHFYDIHKFKEETKILTARANDILQGYMILTKKSLPNSSLRSFQIIDFFVMKDSTEIIDALIFKAFKVAKLENVHSINLVGFTDKIRDRFMLINPIVKKIYNMPFWFITKNSNLSLELLKSDSWYPGPYDGDSSL